MVGPSLARPDLNLTLGVKDKSDENWYHKSPHAHAFEYTLEKIGALMGVSWMIISRLMTTPCRNRDGSSSCTMALLGRNAVIMVSFMNNLNVCLMLLLQGSQFRTCLTQPNVKCIAVTNNIFSI
jgi:hypothetical protein